jgi:hypothetical protein
MIAPASIMPSHRGVFANNLAHNCCIAPQKRSILGRLRLIHPILGQM